MYSTYPPLFLLYKRTHHHLRSGTGVWVPPFCSCPASCPSVPAGTDRGGSPPPPPLGRAEADSSSPCGSG